MPEHEVYVEPFGGGGSVLLNKRPAAVEVYNDLDHRLFDIFRVLRDTRRSQQLLKQLSLTPYHEMEYRKSWEAKPRNMVDRARVAIVQLRMSFGGNGSRGVRAGFAFAKSSCQAKKHCNVLEALPMTIERLRRVQIMSRDAKDVISRFYSDSTLTYCDPPYVTSTRKGRCYVHEMDDASHVELLQTLKNCRGKVMVSGYPSKLYETNLRGWRTATRQQALSCARVKGQIRTEVLWMNF